MIKTARFWAYHNGSPVRLKLNVGQTVTHRSGGLTDEGWYLEVNTYSYDGRFVERQWFNDDVDCDGRLIRRGSSYCHVHGLASGYRDEDGIAYPDWTQLDSRQRDYSAEDMNY